MYKKTALLVLSLSITLALTAALFFEGSSYTETQADGPTQTVTPTPVPAGSSNEDWTPVCQEFDGVEMVFVPAGCFVMGSDDSPFSNERPAHEVCLSAFWIDRYEVTIAQFAVFDGQAEAATLWTEDHFPRNTITWYEAQDFCESRGARLPTEAEWEYAARGPEGWIYPWGNDFVPENIVVFDTTIGIARYTGDVSWVGAQDLEGSAEEWVADWYTMDYSASMESGALNPTGPEEGMGRVHRGGYPGDEYRRRVTMRKWDTPDFTWVTLGLRCARGE